MRLKKRADIQGIAKHSMIDWAFQGLARIEGAMLILSESLHAEAVDRMNKNLTGLYRDFEEIRNEIKDRTPLP